MDNSKSDEAIARRLADQKYIRACELDVWLRSREGVTVYSMRRDYPNELRPGKFYYETTLFLWIQKVDKAIADARLITADMSETEDRTRYRIAVAQGHDVHDADNPTPQRRVPTDQSTWNEERLAAAGALDRHSRKRA